MLKNVKERMNMMNRQMGNSTEKQKLKNRILKLKNAITEMKN